MGAYNAKDAAATYGRHNLRYADCSVEQTQISPHVSVALQGVGNKSEWHGQHGRPARTYHQERDNLQILVVQKRYQDETRTADYQTDGIGNLGILEHREHHGPRHTAYCLYGKEYAHPVASFLKRFGAWVGSVPNGLGDGTGGIVPKI